MMSARGRYFSHGAHLVVRTTRDAHGYSGP